MKYKNIYVICPYGLVTGGPDALHQFVFYCNSNNIDSSIIYCDINNKNKPIPTPYMNYVDKYGLMSDIIDNDENAIVVPETLTHLLKKFNNIKKYVWWLSVQNDTNAVFKNKLKTVFKKIFNLNNIKKVFKIRTLINYVKHKPYKFDSDDVIHLCASYYAFDYVSNKTSNCHLLIEPISKYFLENSYDLKEKKNVCLYNPKKNINFTKKIIKKASNINFIPLIGYSQKELIDLYASSKVYIDFGFFPGAERIPKEAVKCGCCVITGKNGASAFYNDVPVLDEYKFDSKDENIDKIIDKIMYCFINYDEIKKDFDEYRSVVNRLESNFVAGLIDIFS